MLDFYWIVFGVFATQALGLMWKDGMFTTALAGAGDQSHQSAAFKSFRNNYLIVYSLQMREWGLFGTCAFCLAHGRAHSRNILQPSCTWQSKGCRESAAGAVSTHAACECLHSDEDFASRQRGSGPVAQELMSHSHPTPAMRHPQLETGCKGPMYMRCMPIMATAPPRLGSSSLLALDLRWCLAQWWAR